MAVRLTLPRDSDIAAPFHHREATTMEHYKNHPIYAFALPSPGKRWRSIGMVFSPASPTKEIKRLEFASINHTTSAEAEEYALSLCKAWVDGLKLDVDKTL